MNLDTGAVLDFCSQLQIPSKDEGLVPLKLWGTQRYWLDEVDAGLEQGVHEFVTLKGGRQIGGSTIADALAIYWPQEFPGIQGLMVSDDDDNRDYRRDVLLAMNESLPKAYRLPMRLNNRALAAWPNGSRLGFRAAGKRTGSNLGRSRGINFLHADEVGSWPDEKAISSLKAAMSERSPIRLFLWNSTARGIGSPFHEMWQSAEKATRSRAIFVAWWRHGGYTVRAEDDPETFKRYGRAGMNDDERRWTREIYRRYGVEITREQMAWFRWKLAEQMFGDEVMMAQEFACLPEDAFQAFGDKFISPHIIRRLRIALSDAPTPKGMAYNFLDTLDETAEHGMREVDPGEGPLTIWKEPDPAGVYVVSAHPQYSSSEAAGLYVIQAWRAWPDRLEQVAEYRAAHGAMYQFAWACIHLAGAYRTQVPTYFILEVGSTGMKVAQEIQLLERYGYGLSVAAKGKVHEFLGSIRHYFHYRPDMPMSRRAHQEFQTSSANRAWVLNGLRDALERQQMTIRSADLVDALASMRQGEDGNADVIAGAAGLEGDSQAMCAALAIQCWLEVAMPELVDMVSPVAVTRSTPTSAEQRLVGNYLGGMLRDGRPRSV